MNPRTVLTGVGAHSCYQALHPGDAGVRRWVPSNCNSSLSDICIEIVYLKPLFSLLMFFSKASLLSLFYIQIYLPLTQM